MDLLKRFKLLAAEFKEEGDVFLQDHLDLASSLIATDIDKDYRDDMVCYLAAHRIDQSLKRQGASGQVTSLKEGGSSITYANPTSNSEYDFSSYGRAYEQLVKQTQTCPMTRSM